MSNSRTVQTEDFVSVGSRISWPAIFAGAALALGLQFLLGVLAIALGGPANDRGETDTLRTSAMVLAIAGACLAMFAGGVVTTQLTAGENKVEAAIYGIVMWATVTAIVAHGASAARGSFFGHANQAQTSTTWESSARQAGVPADQVQQWKTKLADDRKTESTTTVEAPAAKRWYAVAGIWLSMIAATAGALVGAGPTFRLVTVTRPLSRPTL